MDALHAAGIHFAEVLQSGPRWMEDVWLTVTSSADPKCIFTICFPLAYFLDRKVGVAVLWVGLLAEWLNVVCKWFLFGERPFWWIHESGFGSGQQLTVRQFPVSCETGPGSPSGHCMITGAALWPLVSALTALASRHSKSLLLKLIPFTAYMLLLVAVGLSRVYVLAHFPHQVLSGIVAGAVLGWGLQARTPITRSMGFFAVTSLGLLLGSIALHGLMIAAGVDIDWSIRLATTWCKDPSWLRLDTRPFASICRVAGSALGLGLAAGDPKHWDKPLPPRQRAACAVLALAAVRGLQHIPQPQQVTLWYTSSFIKYAAGPGLVAVLLPRIARAITRPQSRPHAQ
ncbi:glucose-6-phosphatase 3 [Coturnix japonica]|uniref:Glucose-6-phosphatase n=1 Tax=Coturnix japonica TaxID=93934 RepID=A0A8C2YGC0_COTJA|nr:glucose-6-phosphatase 3 [Coturnix japonica]